MGPIRRTVVLGFALLVWPPVAGAQQLWLNAAVQRDTQRFEEDVVPNRLDGAALGWTIALSILAVRHALVSVEWSEAGTIDDVRTATLDANGRTVTITSALTHRTRALSILGGYSHGAGARVRLAYLGGVALTRVRRQFTSTAADALLNPPSDRTASAPPIDDRFATLAGGADALVRISGHVHALAGARIQRLELAPDLGGWSVRAVFGGGWTF